MAGSLMRSPIAADARFADAAPDAATGRTGSPACSRGRSRGRRSRTGRSSRRLSAQNANALRSTSKPDPGSRYAMMSRRARPSARTTGPRRRLPASRSTATALVVPRSVPPEAGPVTGNGSCTSVEGGSERSTGSPARTPEPARTGPADDSRLFAGGSPSGLRSQLARWSSTAVDPTGTLLRPLRVAGSGVPRGRGGDPLPGRSPSELTAGNAYFQDVLPLVTRTACRPAVPVPFPPLPAVVLLPFVAVWGLDTDDQAAVHRPRARSMSRSCWWMLGRLRSAPPSALATTIFFAFGTVFWYTAQLATTWYQAHIVAVGLTMLAIGLALRRGPGPRSTTAEDARSTTLPVAR